MPSITPVTGRTLVEVPIGDPLAVDESPGSATTGVALAMPIAHTAHIVRAGSKGAIPRGELLILSLAITGRSGLRMLMRTPRAGGGTANQPQSPPKPGTPCVGTDNPTRWPA